VAGEPRLTLERELDQIRSLLTAGEPDQLTLPTLQPNTNLATAAYAATPAAARPTMRARLFAAHWIEGSDLGDSDTLARLGVPRTDRSTAARWRSQWLALTEPIVPMMVLPDGYVSRGLGALARLAQLAEDQHRADTRDAGGTDVARTRVTDPAELGGESPCFAHLLDGLVD